MQAVQKCVCPDIVWAGMGQSEHTNTDGINKVVGHLNSGLRQIIPHCNTIMTGGQLAQVRVYKLNKEQ